jgi:hypothetical protein
MAIAFKCPNCQQPYKVKDDMAGKRVVCTACKKPVRVPVPAASKAAPAHDADALAAAHLADAPPAPAETAAATITVECPNCIEQVSFPADKAGKQAPCPNCKRIIRVPVPVTGKTDWRTADARPTFAKVQPHADLKDVVSTANMKVVDREALAEAGALRKRQREPMPLRVKIRYGIIAGCVVCLGLIAAFLFRHKQRVERRDDLVATGLGTVQKNPGLPAGVRAETYRAAGEYTLRQPDGKAETAREHLANAHGVLTAAKTIEHPFEKTALLTRIVVTQTGLVGDQPQVRAGARLQWEPTLKELRRTLQAFDNDPGQWEGTILAVRELTRALGLRGAAPEQPAVNVIPARFDNPAEKADAQAAIGLELLGAGEEGQKRAKQIAEQLQNNPDAASQPRAVALLAALRLSDPTSPESPPLAVRVGCAEGFARRGDLEAARAIARRPGSPDDRLQAMVALAAAQPDGADLNDAVKLFAEEFKSRDLPDWPLIHLAQLCAGAKSPDAAKNLNAALAGLSGLSSRSEAVRAWAQMELLQSPHLPATDAAVKAIGPEATMGHLLAWESLARRAPDSANAASEAAKPLAQVGAALGSLK